MHPRKYAATRGVLSAVPHGGELFATRLQKTIQTTWQPSPFSLSNLGINHLSKFLSQFVHRIF